MYWAIQRTEIYPVDSVIQALNNQGLQTLQSMTQWFAPLAVRCRTALLLLSFLIVGIHASGISIPLSLLMLLEWSLIWIASLTLRV